MKNSRKSLLLLLPVLLLTVGCQTGTTTSSSASDSTSSSTRETVYVEDFTLDVTEVTLEVGGTQQITPTLSPTNATKKGFTYTSSDATVATVSSSGTITAIKAGTCTITVTTKGTKEDGSTISKEVAVTVTAPKLTSLEVGAKSVTIKEGATAQITWEVKPANASNAVTFVSSDETIATVSDTGLITGVAAGSATITLTTVDKNAAGEALTATVAVTVESKDVVHKVEFQNSDGSLLQAVDDIEVGEVPDFTAETPTKASDSNGIYIFRGFDKEIVPYAESDTPVIYTAVYETVQCTPRKVTLTKETVDGVDYGVITVTGEAIGVTTETIAGKAYLAFAKVGGDWATTYSDPMSPVINADHTWTMQYTINPDKFDKDTYYMSKYIWNSASASNPTDMKVFHRATYTVTTGEGDTAVTETKDCLRYRHTADGEVLEDNKLPDDWNGTFADNYVTDGYIDDNTTSSLSDSTSRQAYVDAIPAPTWVGLGLTYDEVDDLVINNYHYSFTATDETYGLPSFKICEPVAEATYATLTDDADGKLVYRLSGEFESYYTSADMINIFYNLEHNAYYDGDWEGAWTQAISTNTEALHPVIDTAATSEANGTWHYDIPVEDTENFRTIIDEGDSESVFTTHFTIGMSATAPSGNPADLKITNYDTTTVTRNGYEYSLVSTDNTWNVVSLMVKAVTTA